MAKYELALVVNARIEEDKRAAVVDRAKAYIERFGGTLGSTQQWGKKRLAYEIQKMHEGYYYFIKFEAGPECPNELEQNMRIMEGVLRYLIVKIDDNADIGDPNETDIAPAQEEAPAEEAPAQAEPEAQAEVVPAEDSALMMARYAETTER